VGVTEWATIPEADDRFLALFPHRYDYIWAEHPEPGARAAWQTETRYPLGDRKIQQGRALYGVRFGAETRYALLDIDAGSVYHPQRDRFAMANLIAALELLGLVEPVVITSSHSGGLHVYFPLEQALSSWQLAIALTTTLEAAGFKVQPGQLEVFPNPRPYHKDAAPSLFNAHRLPLQTGSYLLDAEFQPIWTTAEHFVQRWTFAQSRNHIDPRVLKRILKQVQYQPIHITGKADKFIADLDEEIELGWTGPGQTNRLLGRITMREYVFRHILSGGEPRGGSALVEAIVAVARSLPGYQQWCRHQHEITQRAEEWVSCIENSHYFPYGTAHGKFKAKQTEVEAPVEASETPDYSQPSCNQVRSLAARDRIRHALANLLEQDILPAKPTARFQALLRYGIGGGSLYRHRDLWHPQYLYSQARELPVQQLPAQVEDLTVENSIAVSDPASLDEGPDWLAPSYPSSLPSLLPGPVGNILNHKDFQPLTNNCTPTWVSNNPAARSSGEMQPVEPPSLEPPSLEMPPVGIQFVHHVLAQIQARKQQVMQQTQQRQVHGRERVHQRAIAQRQQRRHQLLASGDPILAAEARGWDVGGWAIANAEFSQGYNG
jgi:hypothetical protein